MTWIVFNSVLSLFAAGFVAYKLVVFGDLLTGVERFGMGLMGGAMVMTMAILWDVDRLGTPFDGWSTTIFRFGLMIYLAGRVSRFRKYRKAHRWQGELWDRRQWGAGE